MTFKVSLKSAWDLEEQSTEWNIHSEAMIKVKGVTLATYLKWTMNWTIHESVKENVLF